MSGNDVMGIVFPNVQDDLMSEMTAMRSMGSVPFMARYRLIDFALSNLVNAGIYKVGVITKNNYQSLMDHLNSGIYWDLDRKSGGLHILPPFSTGQEKVYTGHIDALAGAINFLKNSAEKYVVLYDTNAICNFDIGKILKYHIEKQADVTFAYKNGTVPQYHRNLAVFNMDGDGRINEIQFTNRQTEEYNYTLDIFIAERKFLIDIVERASELNLTNFYKHIFQPKIKDFKLFGYEVKEYAEVIDGTDKYVRVTREILNNKDAMKSLFNKERPIFTKTRDDMPTIYGLDSHVDNCIVADGCEIDGTVTDSVIFRGVKIGKGATVTNCIIMQDTVIEENSELEYVTLDKDVKITAGKSIRGAETYPLYIRKGAEV